MPLFCGIRLKARRTEVARKKKNDWWLMALFALPFAAVGVGMLALGVLPTLVAAQLRTHRGSKSSTTYSATYSATAHYRYKVAGVQYESRRVAINTSADNVGGFQQRLEVKSVTLGLRFARRFTVPVYATGAQSVWVAHDAASQP